jgi:hypothetical protein
MKWTRCGPAHEPAESISACWEGQRCSHRAAVGDGAPSPALHPVQLLACPSVRLASRATNGTSGGRQHPHLALARNFRPRPGSVRGLSSRSLPSMQVPRRASRGRRTGAHSLGLHRVQLRARPSVRLASPALTEPRAAATIRILPSRATSDRAPAEFRGFRPIRCPACKCRDVPRRAATGRGRGMKSGSGGSGSCRGDSCVPGQPAHRDRHDQRGSQADQPRASARSSHEIADACHEDERGQEGDP